MLKTIEVTGKTESLAIENALAQLGMDRDDVSVEVVARAKTGFLGIGSQPARIRVSYEAPDEPAPIKAEPAKPAPEKEAPARSAPEKAEPAEAPAPAESVEEKPAPKKSSERKSKPARKNPSSKPKGEKAPKPVEAEVEAPAEEAPAASAAQPVDPAALEPGSVEDKIYRFLTGLLAHMGSNAQLSIVQEENGTYQVELLGQGLGSLIGRRGETLDAIQQLTNYSVNRGQNHRARIHLDAESYRAKREESLQRLARKTAGKVVKNRRNITLEPMNAYERHVIHTALQDYRNVVTYSVGTEPNRRIVIAYSRGERYNHFA